MKRNVTLYILLSILLLLDAAAIHDILVKEPDIRAEVITLLLSIPVLTGLVYYKLKLNRQSKLK